MGKSKYKHEDVIAKLNNTPVILLEQFRTTVKDHYLFECKDCAYQWRTRLDHVFDGHYCPRCGKTLRYTKTDVNEKLKEQNIILIGSYVENQTKTTFQCLVCQTKFKQYPLSLFTRHAGCPHCKTRLRQCEKTTEKCLNELLPNTTINKPFQIKEPIIINNKKIQNYLLVDFQFILDGQEYFVEYNGGQHYQPTRFFNFTEEKSIKMFEKQKVRDEWLRQYCRNHSIILIEIDGRKIRKNKIKSTLSGRLFPKET